MGFRLHLIIIVFAFLSLTTFAHSVVEQEGFYEVEHSWTCNGKQCSITLNISTNLYNYYQNEREHLAYRYQFNGGEIPPNYYGFMLSEHDRYVLRTVADEFSNNSTTEREKVELALYNS